MKIESKYGIVIPCYNEEKNLTNLIEECIQIQNNSNIRFILVNNGSSDSTIEILTEYKNKGIQIEFLNLKSNQGYGGGILAGLSVLTEDFIGWIHADMQTDLKESLLKLQKGEFDYYKGIRTGRSASEKIFSFSMGLYCSIVFKRWLYEINAQPTVMSRRIYETWKSPPTDFSLDLYSYVLAKKYNAKIRRDRNRFMKRMFGESRWNTGLKSQLNMSLRTIKYCNQLFRSI